MTGASRKFRPPTWATLGLILACCGFVAAGMWQLDRGSQKRRLFSEFDASGVGTILQELVADDQADLYRYQQFRIAGRYDSERQILLDNMLLNGQVGYQVITPLRIDGRSRAVLINRGWVPADPHRDVLPEIDVGKEPREIIGLLNRLPQPGIRLATDIPGAGAPWPRRQLFPTAKDIGAQLGYPVTDYLILLDSADADGYTREWRPQLMKPGQHLSYAVQWFGFAVTLCIIYVIVNLKKESEDRSS